MQLRLQRRLMSRQCLLQPLRVALQHPAHLSEAEAERAKGDDSGGASHLFGAIGTPACRGPLGRHQPALLVNPQGLG